MASTLASPGPGAAAVTLGSADILEERMATDAQVTAKTPAKGFVYTALILGWLVPGAGHFYLKRWKRGLLLLVSISLMFVLGIAMQGKLYAPNTDDLLNMLGFAGDLGSGLLYVIARMMDVGHGAVQVATADYGTKFAVVAGLLNIIAAVDAHNIATGRKP